MQMRALLKSIRGGKIQGVLVEILEKVDDEEDWNDTHIDLS
jgi:hypothetical protein